MGKYTDIAERLRKQAQTENAIDGHVVADASLPMLRRPGVGAPSGRLGAVAAAVALWEIRRSR